MTNNTRTYVGRMTSIENKSTIGPTVIMFSIVPIPGYILNGMDMNSMINPIEMEIVLNDISLYKCNPS